MSERIEITGSAEVSPELLAKIFWNMDSLQQARFFAELNREAGHKLDLQMCYVVDEIVDLADKGQSDARDSYLTLFERRMEFVSDATSRRHYRAREEIRRMGERR